MGVIVDAECGSCGRCLSIPGRARLASLGDRRGPLPGLAPPLYRSRR